MKVKAMTKQYNEYGNLLQSDRVASGAIWNKRRHNSLCDPMVHQKTLALVSDVGRPL